jgi:hypothetical protein
MNFLYKNFKRLPFDLICLSLISFFYLFFSNLFLIDCVFVLYITPLIFSFYLKNHLKLPLFEFHLFIFGFLNDILSRKMLGMTSFLNLIIFYILSYLNKNANKMQSFLYSVCVLIVYMIYDVVIYKFKLHSYHEMIIQRYNLYFLIFCLNFLIIMYMYFFADKKKNHKALTAF